MVPILGNQSPENHHYSPKKLKICEFKTKSYITFRLCSWLLITICFQVLLIVFISRDSQPSRSPSTPIQHHHFQQPSPRPRIENQQWLIPSESIQQDQLRPPSPPIQEELVQVFSRPGECESGRVYVYDLPPMFNKELIDNCHDLDPWSSRCNAVSNGGFGPKAIGLDGIVPKNLTPAWYWTDMYAAEVIYHNRMLSYKCRTLNPDHAMAYYMPFYVGLAVGKYLWFNYTSKDRDRHSEMLLNWVKDQLYWKTSNGSDHFIMLGRLTWDFRRLTNSDSEWGTSFIYMPLMKNVMRLSVERSPWDALEVSVPYPTAFHPSSESDISQWQNYIRDRKRTSLFCFVGATRTKIKNDFRGVLMNYCKKEYDSCKVVDCAVTHCYDGAPAILEAFLDTDFCFQPKGDGFTRRSFYDCMLAGSIPVYFWEGSFKDQYQWHLPDDARSYSVFINHNQVRNDTSIIKTILERYSKDEIKKMREKIISFMPRFLYARSGGDLGSVDDAFDIAIDGVLRRFKQQKEKKNLT